MATPTTLVVFPGALGDFICFLPTLSALRRRRADVGLALVVQASLLPLAIRPGLADDGVALESAAIGRLFVEGEIQTSPVPGMRVGDVYSWFASGDPVVRENLSKLAGGKVRCARFAVPEGYEAHVANHFLEGAGLPSAAASTSTRISLRASEQERARDFWQQRDLVGRPVLAVHRGAGSPLKRWSEDGHLAVTRWWRGRGGRVLEIAGPADPDEPLVASHVMARGHGIDEVAGLLARVDLFLGCDTGVSHLAGAVGTRGVVVFGPTRARLWRPLGGQLICLNSAVPGIEKGPISIGAVSIERVIRTLDVLASMSRLP